MWFPWNSFILFAAVQCVASTDSFLTNISSSVEVTSWAVTNSKVLLPSNVETVYEFPMKLLAYVKPQAIRNKNNVFHFFDEDSIVSYDYSEKNWYEYDFDTISSAFDTISDQLSLVPVSRCFHVENGTFGKYSTSYEVSVLLSHDFSIGGKINISDVATSIGIGKAVAKEMIFLGSFGCSLPGGKYGQMFVEPIVEQIPEGQRRKMFYKDGFFEYADLLIQHIPLMTYFARVIPNHYCLSYESLENLQCDANLDPRLPKLISPSV